MCYHDDATLLQIILQEETIEEFTTSSTDPLTVSLYQMDVDRTMFLLRSYLRIRLQKVPCVICYALRFYEIETSIIRFQ